MSNSDYAFGGVLGTLTAVMVIVITVGVSSCSTTANIKRACDLYGHVELYSANGESKAVYSCTKDQHNE